MDIFFLEKMNIGADFRNESTKQCFQLHFTNFDHCHLTKILTVYLTGQISYLIYFTADLFADQRKALCWQGIPEFCCARNYDHKEVKPVQMNICGSNTYRKDLSWPHFHSDPRVQQSQYVLNQHFFKIIRISIGIVNGSLSH